MTICLHCPRPAVTDLELPTCAQHTDVAALIEVLKTFVGVPPTSCAYVAPSAGAHRAPFEEGDLVDVRFADQAWTPGVVVEPLRNDLAHVFTRDHGTFWTPQDDVRRRQAR